METFPAGPNRSIEFGPKFPEILVEWIAPLDSTVDNSNWCFDNLWGGRLPVWKQSDEIFDDDYRTECRNVPQCQQGSY